MPESKSNYYSDVINLANEAKRFCDLPEEKTSREQLCDRFRIFKETGSFHEFSPLDECMLEDWVGQSARRIKVRHVCPQLFQEMWSAAAGETYAATIMKFEATDYEAFVDHVALELFPHSTYVRSLERVLWGPPRAQSVHQAALFVRSTAAMYLRLCKRRKRQVSITNTIIRESLLSSVPRVVEDELRLQRRDKFISDILEFAPEIEAEHRRRELEAQGVAGAIVPQVPAGPATPVVRRPLGACHGCGETGHWRNE